MSRNHMDMYYVYVVGMIHPPNKRKYIYVYLWLLEVYEKLLWFSFSEALIDGESIV